VVGADPQLYRLADPDLVDLDAVGDRWHAVSSVLPGIASPI
jgi:hypothetical protein